MLIEMAVEFRLCRAEDLPALEWMGLYMTQREIIAQAFAAQEKGEAALLLALANGFPVGQAWLDFARRGTPACPRLWAMRVFPPLQGCGLGTRLMQEAERIAARRGAERIEIGVERDNPAARRFYARLGLSSSGAERELVRYSFENQALTMDVDQELMRKPLALSRVG